MADTVKKSRIVSDNDDNLEEALMEEFNIRLKSCMSQDNLRHSDDDDDDGAQDADGDNSSRANSLYENVEAINVTVNNQKQQQQQQQQQNHSPSKKRAAPSADFIQVERDSYYEEPPHAKAGTNGHNDQRDSLADGNGHGHESNGIYDSVADLNEKTDATPPPKAPLSDQYVEMSSGDMKKTPPEVIQVEYEDMEDQGIVLDDREDARNVYEVVEPPPDGGKPILTLPTTSLTDMSDSIDKGDEKGGKSARDRMFLSTDDTSCLLFTQTVTSPMLTPSEENIDFLKGFRRESNQTTSPDASVSNGSPKSEQVEAEDKDEEVFNGQIVTDLDDVDATMKTITFEGPLEPIYANLHGETNAKPQHANEETGERIYENMEFLKREAASPYENVTMVQNGDVGLKDAVSQDVSTDLDASQEENSQQLEESPRDESADPREVSEPAAAADAAEDVSEKLDASPQQQQQQQQQHHICQSLVVNEESVAETCEDLVQERTRTPPESPQKAKQVSPPAPAADTRCRESFSEEEEEEEEEGGDDDDVAIRPERRPQPHGESIVAKMAGAILKSGEKESVDECGEPINRERDTETVPAQIVRNLKSQFMNAEVAVVAVTRKEAEPTGELKTVNILKQITRFEQREADEEQEDSTMQVHESYSETTTFEQVSGAQDKALKKKKSKKSRKEEKENISVNVGTNGVSYYNVNVKSLCRSFGDLTKLEDDRNFNKWPNNKPTNDHRLRAKSLTDVTQALGACRPIENVFSGVCVKALKSSFNKFDALQKKNLLHVRSSDSTKAQEKFNGTVAIDNSNCKSCGKVVFQMEQMKAEKSIWHKNCFRCQECSKQLNVDTYQSHEGTLYCKPHFKSLFAPKVVEDEEPPKPRKHELIIRENQPMELPPDVVRASDKPDLGLEELQSLNVKQRFQVFEHHQTETSEVEKNQAINVKKSPSILSKLAKFQAKGMDIGVADDSLNGIPIEESESEEEEEEIPEGEDPDLVRAKRVQREKPFHFTGMLDVKNKWEHGEQNSKDERREERKQEIQSIRNRLFMGKQGKMKEAYQQAVMESESKTNRKNTEAIEAIETKSLKERFEKGQVLNEQDQRVKDDEEEVYESEISKKSRSLFLELDANASKPPQLSPTTPPKLDVRKAREAYLQKSASQDVVRSSEVVDEVEVQTADIQQRFKFFETYKEPAKDRKTFRITPPREGQIKAPTPDREVYRDPDVIRAEEIVEDSVIAKETHTATKMLNKFRQMEESLTKEPAPQGPKPLKRFTPPPEPTRAESDSEEESGSEEESEGSEDAVDTCKLRDEDLIEAQKAARAKQLRAKFEKWEANEIKREQNNSSINIAEECGEEQSQIESTKVLRARFESMRETTTGSRTPRVKVNRFVIPPIDDTCKRCRYKVYPLEKISVHGDVYHKNCFKCMECSAILRMDSYSYNQGLLYCTPHFKRLFISKGNYDTGFGLDQHKEKWNTSVA